MFRLVLICTLSSFDEDIDSKEIYEAEKIQPVSQKGRVCRRAEVDGRSTDHRTNFCLQQILKLMSVGILKFA